jgi:hypothetical protein
MFCPSILDALAPYVGAPTGLQIARCSKELQAGVAERIQAIIQNDYTTWPIVICKALGHENPSLQDIATVHERLVKKDFTDVKTLLHKTNLATDMDFQDFFFDHYVFDSTDYIALDKNITLLLRDVFAYFETITDHETKVLCFSFSFRIIGRLIDWLVSHGVQDKVLEEDDILKVHVISHTRFMQILLNRMAYFSKHTDVVKDKHTRYDFEAEMRFNKKYVLAWAQKLHNPGMSLFIGPSGGIYTVTPKGARRYFR